MAKKKKKLDKYQWIQLYKDYFLQHGELVPSAKELATFADSEWVDLKMEFNNLQQLEAALVLLYFKQANELLVADEKFEHYSSKEKHLAFLYVLTEKIGVDELFLSDFLHKKRLDPGFIMQVLKLVNSQELDWTTTEGWAKGTLDKINFHPKKTALINHALGCLTFYLKDTSEEKQDTDAFIEKTTDLLFKLTDTSTLHSAMDLGKFLFSRRKTAFSWD